MRRRAFLRTAAGLFVPAILGRAAVPMSVSDPAFLGRHRVTSAPAVPFAYEDFESYATGAITASDLTGYTGFAAHPALYGSAVSIGQNTFADGLGKYLLVSNAEYSQQLSVGSDWTTLRIGILWATPETTNTVDGTHFIIGCCAGTTNVWNNGTTANEIAADLVGRGYTNPWHFQYAAAGAVDPVSIWYGTGGVSIYKKVNGTRTEPYNDSSHGGVTAPGDRIDRVPYFIEITKGSPNWTVSLLTPGAGRRDVDTPKATFATYMQASIADMEGVYGFVITSPPGFAFDETAGSIDSIDLWWNQAKSIYLYEIAAYKFS